MPHLPFLSRRGSTACPENTEADALLAIAKLEVKGAGK